MIAQSLKELRRISGRQPLAIVSREQRGHGAGLSPVGRQQRVRQCVRAPTQQTPHDDAARQAAQILNEHHAQSDGDRPQFANAEGLYALIRTAVAR